MKKHVLLTLLNGCCLLGISLLLDSCDSDQPPSELKNDVAKAREEMKAATSLSVSANEDSIYLNPDIVTSGKADSILKTMQGCILLNGKAPDNFAAAISADTIASWQSEAEHMKPGGTGSRYVTALKFSYGVDANSKMVLMYQPLCLYWVATSSSYTLTTAGMGNGRIFNGKGFDIIKPTDFDTKYGLTYRNQLKIAHTQDPSKLDNFAKVGDPMGPDATAAIYPFQEIYEMLNSNASDSLKIWNLGSKRKSVQDNNTYVRHDLLLGPPNLFLHLDSLIFYKVFSDLSHLCPPSCSTFTYQLKQSK